MNNIRLLLIGFLFAAAVLPVWGRPIREKPVVVQAEGLVRLVGNEPFTEIVISGSEDTWYINQDEKHKLMDLQQRTVTVEGEVTEIEMRFANGTSAGKRRLLTNIKVIAVKEDY